VAAESLAAESARLRQLDAHEPLRGHMASCGPRLSSVSKRAFWREDLKQESSIDSALGDRYSFRPRRMPNRAKIFTPLGAGTKMVHHEF
jgi:hypothetical protein